MDGWQVLFDAKARRELRLDELPAGFRHKHEEAIASGHCNLLLIEALPAQALTDGEGYRPRAGHRSIP